MTNPDTPATPRIENAADVLSTAAPLPDATMTAPPAGAAPPAALPEKDRDGQVHNPAVHETPARLNSERRWARLRGNAARKAKGLPPSGRVLGSGKPAAPVEPAGEPAPPPQPASVSTPPPDAMLNGGPVLGDGIVDPEGAQRPFADYATTAGGIVDGSLGLAQIGISDAWKPTPQERTVLVGAVQRVWHEHQLPVLGSAVELVLVLVGFVAKRRTDEPTASLFRRLFRRGEPAKPVDPHAPPVEPAPTRAVVVTAPRRSSPWD